MKQLSITLLATLFLFWGAVSSLTAQNTTFSDVTSIQLRSSGTISDNDGIKGYFFFYKKEKVDRKTNSYLLKILDQNLKSIAEEEIVDSKNLVLQQGTYNGDAIMLKFYDVKEKELSYRVFTKEGKLKNNVSRKIEDKYEVYSFSAIEGDPNRPNTMFAVGNKGFVDYTFIKEKRVGYKMAYIPTDGSKGWTFKSDPATKETMAGSFLFANEEVILSAELKRPKLMSNKGLSFFIVAHSVNDGKKLWDIKLEDPGFEVSLLNTYTDEKTKELVLFGSYFEKGKNITKSKSLGVFSFVVNQNSGKIAKRNFISWVDDAGKFLPISDKGKIDDVGYVFFHQFIKTADGRVFGIGEQYYKAVSASGVALSLLASATDGRGASMAKMVVKDFYIFEFNEDFSLKDIKIFEKGKSNIMLPEGFEFLSAATIAQHVKNIGGFDYYFTQSQDGGEVFHVGYLDYDREEDKGQKEYFGALTYADGEFSTDKVVLKVKKKVTLNVMPAKAGHILILEYDRKEQTLDLHLEPFNF